MTSNLVQTKLFGWAVENTAVWTICFIRTLLIPGPEPIWDKPDEKPTTYQTKLKRILYNILVSYASSVTVEIGSVYALKIVDWLFFQNVPHFVKQKRSSSPFTWNAFLDWQKGNFHLQLLGGGIALGLVESLIPRKYADEIATTKFDFMGFLRNMAIFRVAVDVVFYLAHRQLHENRWLYENVHRRHHEHSYTNLRTNMHFSGIDLFVESAFPIGVAFAVIRFLFGVKLGRWELHLLQGYAAWHESGTHLGKPLLLISQYPPLSPLYHAIWPSIDARTIEFHETHHNLRSVNMGINQWVDWLAGTREFHADGLRAKVVRPSS